MDCNYFCYLCFVGVNLLQDSYPHQHLAGVPKALLPGVGGKRILDFWWEAIKTYVT